jgi:hypothetical protein
MRTLSILALLCIVGVAIAQQPPQSPDGKSDAQPHAKASATEMKARRATHLKIEVSEQGAPSATISIPLWLARTASSLMLKQMPKQLEGLNVEEILKLAENPPENGVLLDVTDHQDKSRVVISLVGE